MASVDIYFFKNVVTVKIIGQQGNVVMMKVAMLMEQQLKRVIMFIAIAPQILVCKYT